MNDKQHFTHPTPLRLASRGSQLALIQADIVRDLLCALPMDISTEIKIVVTKGDQVLDRPLAEIGGKGLFIKQLEKALLDGEADVAIHSMKDMETDLAAGTELAAILPRGDVRDALIGADTLDALPAGARIGTASVRRRAWLLHHRPDLDIQLLRGNVNSRIKRQQAGEFDAIILAVAGLQRLAIDIAYSPLDVGLMPPSAAQGALAIQMATPDNAATDNTRAASIKAVMALLHDTDTADRVTAERALLARLDGSCRTPISAYAELDGDNLHLYGAVLSLDGRKVFTCSETASRVEAAALGDGLGQELLARCGGKAFLA